MKQYFLYLLIILFGTISNSFSATTNIEEGPKGIEFIDKAGIENRDSDTSPISFIENVGQFNRRVDYVGNSGSRSYWFTSQEIVFNRILNDSSSQEVIRLSFVDAKKSDAKGIRKQSGYSNFIQGSNPENWEKGVTHYGGVKYNDIYSGIDAVFTSKGGILKSDFIIKPNANIEDLRLSYEGADEIRINSDGELVLTTEYGEFIDGIPLAYQEKNKNIEYVDVSYKLSENGIVTFGLGDYDINKELIIDPFLKWSSFLGGDGWDDGMTIEYGSDGSIYVISATDDHEFPYISTGVYQEVHGGPTPEEQWGYDIFVTKVSADGTTVEWSTFLGGVGNDIPYESTIDASNNLIIVGETTSTNFPTTAGAYQTTYGGGAVDAFMVVLSSDGTTLNYGTYLGGSLEDRAYGVVLGSSGDVYVSGETYSTDYPYTTGAYQTTRAGLWDAFISHINPVGGGNSDLQHSTYFGGSNVDLGRIILRNTSGSIVMTGMTQSSNLPTAGNPYDTSHNGGYDAFVAEFNSTLSTLNYNTFLGGAGNDYGHGLAEASNGDVFISGYTASPAFPTTSGAYDETFNGDHDATISRLSMLGNGTGDLLYSTFFGGSDLEWSRFDGVGTTGVRMNNIIAGCGDMIYMTIGTMSTDVSTTLGAYDQTFNTGTGGDRVIIKLNPAGGGTSDLLYSTYLGSTHRDHNDAIIINQSDESIAITAGVFGWDFPTTSGVFQPTHGNDGLGEYQEDAIIASLNFIDYGDAPDSYGTYKTSSGPRHLLGKLRLGSAWDAESDGNPNVNADGDDNLADAPDDEDGIQLDASYIANTQGSITATVTGGSGWLAGWFDWNGNGVFDSPSERTVYQAVTEGANVINFTVPLSSTAGTSYARFRLSQSSGDISDPTSTSLICGGEIEDYKIIVAGTDLDFGDLPDSPYKTYLSSDGARHYQDGLTYLGTPAAPPPNTDFETDGQPNNTATGDDSDGTDDEDGVTFDTPLIPGEAAQITVSAGVEGYLNAWIDYNDDGDFIDTGEQIADDMFLNEGNNLIIIEAVPMEATGAIKSRFRFTSGLGEVTTPYGAAPNGEVEDYVLASVGDYVWEDLYNGKQNFYEDGLNDVVVFLYDDMLTPVAGTSTKNNPTTGDPGWYEFPGVVPGDYYIEFNILGGYDFTLKDAGTDDSIDSDADETNGWTDLFTLNVGETNNTIDAGMKLQQAIDFGDLPEVYQTYIANDGPGHVIDGIVYLGTISPDDEANGQPNSSASGDDGDGSDDEDGITFLNPLHPNQSADINVVASTGGKYLNAWIDFNNNSVFSDAGEQIATDLLLDAGVNTITIPTVPASANGPIYSRFRFSSDTGLSWFGPATDGEVEDYALGSIGNYIWVDFNSDGIQNDGNSSGMNGVQVNLLNDSGLPVLDRDGTAIITYSANNTQTGHPGYYEFPGLPVGNYIIEVVEPQGYAYTSQDQGGNDETDSDINVTNGRSAVISISAGQSSNKWDAGFYPSGCITTVTNTDDNGVGSLRDAIICANYNSGTQVIDFNITGTGPHTIYPSSELPMITDPVVIDGTTEPDFVDSPVIELNGTGAGSDVSGLIIKAGGSTVKGLVVNNFSASGIRLEDLGGNTILGNYIGTDVTGLVGNEGNFVEGIYIYDSPNNIIGGNTDLERNVITGNRLRGIWIDEVTDGPGASSSNTQIRGNYIGTNATGTDKIPYTTSGSPEYQQIGIAFWDAIGNTIGGTIANTGNVISGNAWYGIYLWGANSDNNLIEGNIIGMNANGTAAVGNGFEGTDRSGVYISDAPGNTIGGNVVNARNYISGNIVNGVSISGTSSTDNTISGNYIGTNIAGTGSVPNGSHGILIDGAANNKIGGVTATEANKIANNTSIGIGLEGGTNTTGISILRNEIYSNGSIGIDIGVDGVTHNDGNDVDTGENDKLNFPTITSVVQNGSNFDVDFNLDVPADKYRIEFFDNPNGSDGTGYGEGQTFLDTSTIDHPGGGSQSFSVSLSDVSPTGAITATTTVDNNDGTFGSTSEFSEAFMITAIGNYVWLDSNKDGIQDGGEPGLENITVNLYYSGGSLAGSTTTNANGNYSFTNLTAGDYYLEVIKLPGHSFSPQDQGGNNAVDSDVNTSTGLTPVTTLNTDENDDSWDAGMYENTTSCPDNLLSNPGFESDFTDWELWGAEQITTDSYVGSKASETVDDGFIQKVPGTAGTDYTLTAWAKADNTGGVIGLSFYDSGDNWLDETSVDVNGTSYSMYTVNATAPANTAKVGAWVNYLSIPGSMKADEFCLTEDLTVTIGDLVWNDANGSGIQDIAENGISNVVINLLDSGGSPALDGNNDPITDITDVNGNYEFSDIDAGSYIIEIDDSNFGAGNALEGLNITVQNIGLDDAKDSDGDNTLHRAAISLAQQETNQTIDFGYYLDTDNDRVPDGVEGTGDHDGDGIADNEDYDPSGYIYDEATGEIISGGLIEVTGPGAINILEDGTAGYYEFYTDGTAGTYTITLTEPTGYEISTTCLSQDPPPLDPTGGPDPTILLGSGEDGSSGYLADYTCVNNTFYYTFDLEAGDPFILNNNFPIKIINTGTIGNYLWNDENHNGVQDDGAGKGVGNVTVDLIEAGPDATFETGDDISFTPQVTDVNGVYEFTALPGGNYRVTVDETSLLASAPTLVYQTYDYDDIGTPYVAELILAEAGTNSELDFGFSDTPLPVTLSDFSAEVFTGGVKIHWTTESEIENQGFIIERRNDTSPRWREITSYLTNSGLRGHGTVTQRNEYEYTDQLVQAGQTYEYRLADVDYNTAITYHNELTIKVKVTDIVAIPKQFILEPAYPNPFNPITNIRYALPEACFVKLEIFNISGTLVRTLVNNFESAGTKQVFWNGRNTFGQNISGGVYLYRLEAGDYIATRKMLLLR